MCQHDTPFAPPPTRQAPPGSSPRQPGYWPTASVKPRRNCRCPDQKQQDLGRRGMDSACSWAAEVGIGRHNGRIIFQKLLAPCILAASSSSIGRSLPCSPPPWTARDLTLGPEAHPC
jgi:hypothetical protein